MFQLVEDWFTDCYGGIPYVCTIEVYLAIHGYLPKIQIQL